MEFKDYITPVIDRDYDTLESALEVVKTSVKEKESEEYGVVKFCITDWDNIGRLPTFSTYYYDEYGNLLGDSNEENFDNVETVVEYPDENLKHLLKPPYENPFSLFRLSLHYFGSNNTNDQILDSVKQMNMHLDNYMTEPPVWKTVVL